MKEQTDDNVAEVEIFKADTVDSSKFSSIAEDIISICTNMRSVPRPVVICIVFTPIT